MNRFSIATVAGMVIAVVVIGLQRGQVSSLRKENESLRNADASRPAARQAGASSGARAGGVSKDHREAGTRSDPSDLAAILALSDPMARIRGLLAYVDGLPPDEIPAALAELRKGSATWDPDARMLAHMLMIRLGQEDPETAFSYLDGMDFKGFGADPGSLLSSLAATDPQGAAAWLADPENSLVHYPKMGYTLAATIGREWVRQDPEAALAWAQGLPESQRSGAYSGVLGTLAGNDPRRASELVMTLEPGPARQNIVSEVAEAWARTSPDEALAWAQSLQDGEQMQATREVIGIWAQDNPASAAAFVDGIATEQNVDPYLPEIAAQWAPRAPADAADWVADQPEGSGKNGAMGQVMWNWTTQDPAAAGEWLGGQPDGPARDAGITGLVKASYSFDPGAAVSWSNSISDEERRRVMVTRTLSGWAGSNPDAARQWAEQNGVPVPEPGSGKTDSPRPVK